MKELSPGDVVVVSFPFTDLSRNKVRPAVIVSRESVHRIEDDYTLLFITSVIPDKTEPYEVIFRSDHSDFKESGLKKDSLFKANKIATIRKKLLRRRLGRLGPTIRTSLQEAIRQAIFV